MRYHPGGDVLDRIMHLLASFKQRPKDIDLGQVSLWDGIEERETFCMVG